MVHNYVEPENLEAFLTVLGWIVGYKFDQHDWLAVKQGVSESNKDKDHWFDFRFGELPFSLAQEPGSMHVYVRIELPSDQEHKVNTAIEICQQFYLRLEPAPLH